MAGYHYDDNTVAGQLWDGEYLGVGGGKDGGGERARWTPRSS